MYGRKPLQLLTDRRNNVPISPKNPERYDSEYIRNDTGSIFLFTEPLNGWRYAQAQEHRTKIDWARQIKWLLNEEYPLAKKVVLVMDNLNTHNVSSLYEAFEPTEAFTLAQRLEVHHTPKHGNWLNVAEIELSALGRQCLGSRRISCLQTLNEEFLAWYIDRNSKQKGVGWQFSKQDARIKLKRLYPVLNNY